MRACALVLLAAFLFGAAPATSQPVLFARWEHANRSAIAKIHDAKKRAAAEKVFAATLVRARANGTTAVAWNARAAAAAELAHHGRYHLTPPKTAARQKSLWERAMDWIGKQWDRLWNALFGKVKVSQNERGAFGDLALAIVLLALIVAIVRLLAGVQIERAARRGGSHEELGAQRSARALYWEAVALADRGDYGHAVRVLFMAAVTALDLRGVVRDDAGATVGELRRELRARDARLAEPFDRVANPFVTAAYAESPIGDAEWQRARDAYADLTAHGEAT